MKDYQKSADEFKARVRILAERQRLQRKLNLMEGKTVSYEYEYDDMEYDGGYGDLVGTLIVECEPIIEDGRFDAYNIAGTLSTFGTDYVGGVKNVTATFFAIGNDGEELGEYTFEGIEELKQFGITEEDLIERCADDIANDCE